MKKITQTFILFFLLMTQFITSAFASELWTRYNGNSRTFLVLDYDNGVKVKLYSQTKGDYQDLIMTQSFKDFVEARKYIGNHYPDFTPSKALQSWPIDNSFSNKKNNNLWVAKYAWTDE